VAVGEGAADVSKRALVTGHQGFIGRHMLNRLTALGYSVTGFDVRDAYRVDARDFFRFNSRHYDLVIHCAAVVGGRTTIEGAPLRVAVDLAIDAELFQWALRTQPGAVVYFSSSAAYPTNLQGLSPRAWENDLMRGMPLIEKWINHEDDAFGRPDLTYGWAKLTGEVLAEHARAAGLRVHVFRPFSGYGTDQDLDYPFPSFIHRALRRDDPFEVWGNGEQLRDFIHVDDVVGAVLAAVDQGFTDTVNLCTGRATSFNELARLVTTAAGYSPQLKHLTEAPVGVTSRVGDPTEMLKFYAPKVTLEDGISRALRSLV